jgi:ribonuclease HII
MLKSSYSDQFVEAGCDEAGRGCLAGPVFAAAVIFPPDYRNSVLNDSKKLTAIQRNKLRVIIEREALAWAVSSVDNTEIDRLNILNASILAMHKALAGLTISPQLILVDGNRFKPYGNIPYHTIIKGDGLYLSIAAASVLAKTHRDEHMLCIHEKFPNFGWNRNKGYPTLEHRKEVIINGFSPFHRKTFNVQLKPGEPEK